MKGEQLLRVKSKEKIKPQAGLGAQGVPGERDERILLLSVILYYWEAPIGFSDETWAPNCCKFSEPTSDSFLGLWQNVNCLVSCSHPTSLERLSKLGAAEGRKELRHLQQTSSSRTGKAVIALNS